MKVLESLVDQLMTGAHSSGKKTGAQRQKEYVERIKARGEYVEFRERVNAAISRSRSKNKATKLRDV